MVFFKKIANRIAGFFTKITVARVGFYADAIYAFSYQDGSLSLRPLADDENPRFLVMVVAREHYFESVKTYPIGNLREVKNVVSQEMWRFPYKGSKFERFEVLSEQSSRVTSWIVKDKIFNLLGKMPLLMIPETAAISAVLNSPNLVYVRLGRTVRLIESAEGLFSSVTDNRHSHSKNDQKIEAAPFGLSRFGDLQGQILDSAEFAAKLLYGVRALLTSDPIRFRLPASAVQNRPFPWGSASKLLSFIFLCYLFVTTVYITVSDQLLDSRIDSLITTIAPISQVRKENVHYQNQLNLIYEALGSVMPNWVVGDIILDLIKQGASIRSSRSEDSSVVLFLEAPRAIEVFDSLSQDQRINSVEYAFPVSQSGKKQRFALKIVLNDQRSPAEINAEVTVSKVMSNE
jgi:hypothetical protein